MNLLAEAMAWILDPQHYGGTRGIDRRIFEHLAISIGVLALASAISIPLGFVIGHSGKGRSLVVVLSGGIRALPTLGLITIIALSVGVGLQAPVIALVVLAVPSILAGAYTGFEAVDRTTIDASRAIGLSERQIVTGVEIPLGLPLLMGGLRSASLQVIATATLAAYVGGGGLGGFIFAGLKTRDYPQMLAGSILVIVLAILSEVVFSIIQRLAVPAGVRVGQRANVRARPSRSRRAAA